MVQTTVRELANLVDGYVIGDGSTLISGISSIEDARVGDVTFAENGNLLTTAARSFASAVIAPQTAEPIDKPVIRVKNPKFAFAQALRVFAPEPKVFQGIHATASIGSTTQLGKNVSVHANSVIGEGCTIGDSVVIYPFVYIGDGVHIGNNCVVYPQSTILDRTEIGDGVVIHSGTIIGTDGFGYMFIEDRHYKIPQIGRVIIGDDVEIGANVTIDRARTGTTRIGRGTKIDNLVHIGHNCNIGEHCVIVAQVGISGSVNIGKGVILAGQVGVKDHVNIGDGAIVGARAGVIGDVAAGAFVSGHYARPHQQHLKAAASMLRFPDMAKRLRALEAKLARLEGQPTSQESGGPEDGAGDED